MNRKDVEQIQSMLTRRMIHDVGIVPIEHHISLINITKALLSDMDKVREALHGAKYVINGREDVGFLDRALAATERWKK